MEILHQENFATGPVSVGVIDIVRFKCQDLIRTMPSEALEEVLHSLSFIHEQHVISQLEPTPTLSAKETRCSGKVKDIQTRPSFELVED